TSRRSTSTSRRRFSSDASSKIKAPDRPGPFSFQVLAALGARAHAHQEAVIGELGNLHPLIGVAAESREAVEQLLERRIGRGDFRIEFVGGLVAGLHDLLRERA